MLSAAISGVSWAFTRQRPLRAPVVGFGNSKNTELTPLWDFWYVGLGSNLLS